MFVRIYRSEGFQRAGSSPYSLGMLAHSPRHRILLNNGNGKGSFRRHSYGIFKNHSSFLCLNPKWISVYPLCPKQFIEVLLLIVKSDIFSFVFPDTKVVGEKTGSEMLMGGWGGSSVVNSPCCFCRGPGFSPQHLDDGSQPSETLVLEDRMPSPGLCSHCTHMAHSHTRGNAPIQVKQ